MPFPVTTTCSYAAPVDDGTTDVVQLMNAESDHATKLESNSDPKNRAHFVTVQGPQLFAFKKISDSPLTYQAITKGTVDGAGSATLVLSKASALEDGSYPGVLTEHNPGRTDEVLRLTCRTD